MKKALIAITVISVMALLASPAQADWEDPYTVGTSAELTANAWEALGKGSTMSTNLPIESGYTKAIEWTKICCYFYAARAKKQEGDAKVYSEDAYRVDLANNTTSPETIGNLYTDCWAYSDVSTCWFIMGESFRERNATGDAAKATIAYQMSDGDDDKTATGADFEYFYGLCAQAENVNGSAIGKTDPIFVQDMGANVWSVADASGDRQDLGTGWPTGIPKP